MFPFNELIYRYMDCSVHVTVAMNMEMHGVWCACYLTNGYRDT